MTRSFDLDVATPDELPAILRNAAQQFYESHSELQSAWQDKRAGQVWSALARILERAADQSEKAIAKLV